MIRESVGVRAVCHGMKSLINPTMRIDGPKCLMFE